MPTIWKLFFTVALAVCVQTWAFGQNKPAGDKDDQFVVTGCVLRAADMLSNPPHSRSMFVWSRGDVYLSSPDVRLKPSETGRPVGTTGSFPVVYWLDDENDFAKYVGQHVEIVGELGSNLKKGEIEIEHKDNVMTIEFEVNGREATAKIPAAWLPPASGDREFDVDVRTVDVEKVTVHGACNR